MLSHPGQTAQLFVRKQLGCLDCLGQRQEEQGNCPLSHPEAQRDAGPKELPVALYDGLALSRVGKGRHSGPGECSWFSTGGEAPSVPETPVSPASLGNTVTPLPARGPLFPRLWIRLLLCLGSKGRNQGQRCSQGSYAERATLALWLNASGKGGCAKGSIFLAFKKPLRNRGVRCSQSRSDRNKAKETFQTSPADTVRSRPAAQPPWCLAGRRLRPGSELTF